MENLCPPALIYLVFSVTQIIIDTANAEYNTAFMKFIVAIIFTTLLNYLCSKGLNTISWIIVFIPFILMTLIITLLLFMFGMDPKSGKLNLKSNTVKYDPIQPDARKESKKRYNINYDDEYYDAKTNRILHAPPLN